MSMLILTCIIIIIELIPIIKKKQGKEAVILLLLGAITLAYGYYYNTHKYSASLIHAIYKLVIIR